MLSFLVYNNWLISYPRYNRKKLILQLVNKSVREEMPCRYVGTSKFYKLNLYAIYMINKIDVVFDYYSKCYSDLKCYSMHI